MVATRYRVLAKARPQPIDPNPNTAVRPAQERRSSSREASPFQAARLPEGVLAWIFS